MSYVPFGIGEFHMEIENNFKFEAKECANFQGFRIETFLLLYIEH